MSEIELLLCGVEKRCYGRQGREATLVHLQDRDLRVSTLMIFDTEDVEEDVGKTYTESLEKIQGRTKRFYSWRCQDEGLFPVRGHTVTFHKWFGIQAWLHVEIKTPQGPRNIAVLAAESKIRLYNEEQVRRLWHDVYRDMIEAWPIGLFVEAKYDRTKKKHVIGGDEQVGDIIPPDFSAIPSVGAPSGGELSPSSAR